MLPVSFYPVNPAFSCFVETESQCSLVHTEQQLTHNRLAEVRREKQMLCAEEVVTAANSEDRQDGQYLKQDH